MHRKVILASLLCLVVVSPVFCAKRTATPWGALGSLYDQWGKQDKSAECPATLAALAPK